MSNDTQVEALMALVTKYARACSNNMNYEGVMAAHKAWQAVEASARQLAEQPVKRCPYCDDTGDVHSIDGEWRGTCKCPAGKTEATNIEAAAKVIAERMDYPWEHMYEKGRNNMRDIARAAIDAAICATKGGKL